MVVQAYAVCIGVTLECRWTELEMIRDGWGHADKADKAYHDRYEKKGGFKKRGIYLVTEI